MRSRWLQLSAPLLGLWLLAIATAHGQAPGPRITRWRAAEGLPQSAVNGVALDPRGRLVASHDRAFSVTLLDGYQISSISNSAGLSARAYLSRSDQLWSIQPPGLVEITDGLRTEHVVPEVILELQQRAVRGSSAPPLLPLDRNRTLILLPDRLLEFDARERRTRVLRLAETLGVGRFRDLQAHPDDGAWISAEYGLIRVPAPLRQLEPSTPFESHRVPDHLPVTSLQRPHVDRLGDVVFAAEIPATRTKAVVRFAGGQWAHWSVPAANLRQAWNGADGEFWGITSGSLLRLVKSESGLRSEVVLQAGRIADVAVEPGGISWLATSDGLFRITPLPWRPALGFGPDPEPTYAMSVNRRGQMVALTSRALHWLEGGTWRTVPLPGDTRDDSRDDPLGGNQSLMALPDGAFIVWTSTLPLIFRPGEDLRPALPELHGTRPLGRFRSGALVLVRTTPGGSEWLTYDGESIAPLELPPPSLDGLGLPWFILESVTGELWLGCESGLLTRRGDLWSPAEDAEDGALCGLELPDGRLLIGGRTAVREFDGRRWSTLRRGLDRVHGMHSSRDRTLWVAAGTGLHRYRENGWFLFSEEEGLPVGAAFAALEDASGRLWTGTTRGVFEWNPGADRDPPRAEITSADLPEEAGDTRALFIVGGEDRWRYTSPGRLLYSWRLNTDPWSTWRPAGSAQFTNLATGTHRFFVRAQDPSGNVQEGETRMEFAVALPWFRDPRLVAAVAAVAVLILALAMQAVLSFWRLRRSYAEVERLVAERTAELEKANAELLLSQKMRALGTLAAGIAHDFNNLLSIIRGSAQLLESSLTDPDKSRQRIDRIKTTVDQGAALVRAMLGYSRGGSAPKRVLDPASVVRQTIRLLDERLQSRVRFIAPETALPTISAPPEMLQQIIMNLVQNADDAMDHRGVVSLEIAESSPPQSVILKPAEATAYVAIRVSDRGVGIPTENFPRIFEPFFTTKGFSSRRGTGLGLSMVYEFAKDLGAGITLDSTVGQGSTFTVLLPAIAASAAIDTAPSSRIPPQNTAPG